MNRQRISVCAVLFDWDGTLLNSYQSDARAYLKMFRALGIQWNLRDLARHYSPNWHRVYRAAAIPRARWNEADHLWRRAYQAENPQLLPGARRVLKELHGRFVLGLVTSGSGDRVCQQLHKFRFETLFSVCVCSEDARRRKPHPAPLQLALRRLRLPACDCAYVGDAPEDVEMARRAGARAIAVLGPFPTAAKIEAAKPERLLGSIRDLPKVLAPI